MILASVGLDSASVPTPTAVAARAYELSWRCSDSERCEGFLEMRFMAPPTRIFGRQTTTDLLQRQIKIW